MDEEIATLWELTKCNRITDCDSVLGKKLLNLYDLMENNPNSIPDNMEPLILALITVNSRQISSVVANYIALIAVLYYRSLTKPSYWNILELLQNEVQQQSLPAIVILGIFSKYLCDSFKSKLPSTISFLLTITTDSMQAHICQFFRRVIKGSGSFLKSSLPDIFSFIFRCASSTNDHIHIEAVKTIPCLMSHAQIPRKRLLPILEMSFSSNSPALRNATAKSLAKLMYLSCQSQKDENTASDSYFNPALKIALQFIQTERNIPTTSFALYVFFRYFDPMEIVKRYRVLSKFVLALSNIPMKPQSMCLFARSVFSSIISVCGETASVSLCHFLLEKSSENLGEQKSLLIMDLLANFESEPKIMARAAKTFYPQLTGKKEAKKAAMNFLSTLGKREKKASLILLSSFLQWISSTERDIHVFARGAAMILAHLDINESLKTKIIELTTKWLKENYNTPRPAAALMILAVLNKKSLINQEVLAEVFDFFILIMKNPPILTNRNLTAKPLLKAIALFLNGVINNPPPNYKILQTTIAVVVKMLLKNSSFLPASALLSVLTFSKKCQYLWTDEICSLACSGMLTAFNRFFSPTDITDDYGIYKYSSNFDAASILFKSNIPLQVPSDVNPKVSSLADYLLLQNNKSCKQQLCNLILRDLCSWLSLVNKRRDYISQILRIPTKEIPTTIILLSLLRAAFSEPLDLGQSLAQKAFSIVQHCQTFGVMRILNLQAAALAAIGQTTLQTMNELNKILDDQKSNPTFVCLVMKHLKFETENETTRYLLTAMQLFHRYQIPESVGVIAIMSRKKVIPLTFGSQISEFIMSVLFSECAWIPSVIDNIIEIIYNTKDFPQDMLRTFGLALKDFTVNHSFCLYNSFRILKKLNNISNFEKMIQSVNNLQYPISTLIERASFDFDLGNASLLFMIAQQSPKPLSNHILNLFNKSPDVKVWTEYCKRIVIIGCVPPNERKGDARVAPTRALQLTAMKIALELVPRIKERFPLDLTCVDDIVSIAYTSVHSSDREIVVLSFNIMTNVIKLFGNVRNKECALLELYTSQFVPSLKYAVDGKHDLRSGSEFCIVYLAFLMDSRSPFLGEATSTLISGVANIGDSIEPSLLCRVLGRLFTLVNERDEKLERLFGVASKKVFEGVFKQGLSISSLGNEVEFVVKGFLERQPDKEMAKPLLLVLLEHLESDCSSSVLDTISALIKMAGCDSAYAESVLKIVHHSQLARDEVEGASSLDLENDNGNNDEQENDLDINTFWVVPPRRKPSVDRFLHIISQQIPSPVSDEWLTTFRYVLLMSLPKDGKCYFASLARLTACASEGLIEEFAPSVLRSLLLLEDSKSLSAFFVLFFSKVPPNIAEALIEYICVSRTTVARRLDILITALRQIRNYNISKSLISVASLCSMQLCPDGLNFLGSLLSDKRTENIGVAVLKLGVASAVERESKQLKQLPRILHFLVLTRRVVSSKEFNRACARIALDSLARVSEIKDRKVVVGPAAVLLREASEEARAEFEASQKEAVIKALTPPRQIAQITLKSFGQITSKKRHSYNTDVGGGWQSLDIESSDSDSD